jgi:tetratricopeptide (TPR) repeat protein
MGEFARVEEHLQDALERNGIQVADWEILSLLVDAAARRRDLSALDNYADAADEAASRFNQKLHLGMVFRAKGVAHYLRGKFVESKEQFELSLAMFLELGARWQEGQTYFELGELALKQKQYVIARDNWLAALEKFEAMGALPDVSRTQHKLDSLPQ